MEQRGARARRGVAMGAAAVALVAAGAIGAALVRQHDTGAPEAPAAAVSSGHAGQGQPVAPAGHAGHGAPAPTAGAGSGLPKGEVLLTPEAMALAGIRTARVERREAGAALEIPAVVSPNAYRDVKITPLVGGLAVQVHAELGSVVKRGVPLVTLFSSDLAEAQNRYLSMRALADTERRRLERTEEVAAIGAASRQEVEEAKAGYTTRATELAAARQRLLVLGLTRGQIHSLAGPDDVVNDVVVRAPAAGTITARSVNRGLVVEPGQELLTVTDLSEVWVVGDLYEQDFAAVRVGAAASVRTAAYPDLSLPGRVSYIDPRVDAAARTAKLRVAVPNGDGRLRLGMYVTVVLAGDPGTAVVVVPRSAVQAIGDRQVVYVATGEHEGHFAERTIRTGRLLGDAYTVLEGVEPGDVVATEGSFYLRSESARNSRS